MNDLDKSMDTVLRGLRQAQPDNSLERRITKVLRETQPAAEGMSWFGGWSRALRVAGAVVCVVIAAMLLRPSHRQRMTQAPARASSVKQSIVKRPSLGVAGPLLVHRQAPVSRALHAVAATHAYEAAAATPASFPAPPMPLTEQERLLIRLAHRDDPVQLAQLTPGPRNARYEADKDQVSEFFTPPTPPAQPETNPMESGGGTQ